MDPLVVPAPEIVGRLRDVGLTLTGDGDPALPIMFVDLESGHVDETHLEAAVRSAGVVVVGLRMGAGRQPSPEAFTCTLTESRPSSPADVAVADLAESARLLADAVDANPRAALTLDGLVRATARLPVADGLVAESMAYSMLLGGAEFARWRASRPAGAGDTEARPAVVLGRQGGVLRVTIDRPERRNAFSRHVRDGLAEAFDLARLAPDLDRVVLTGNGPAFCSGGDLDEFGTSSDPVTAHLIRLDRSVAARVHAVRELVEVRLHGACIGAGIEIPSFAGRVVAAQDTVCRLPEVAMGLVPGAGGTVGITRRIGRWRTAYLALSGVALDPETALSWRLVDELA